MHDVDPAWAPDGTRIAFASDRGVGYYRIYVMNADGSAQTMLSDNLSLDGRHPAWRPDGSTIAYDVYQNLACGLFFVDPNGTNQRLISLANLTGKTLFCHHPRWSPNGLRLAFTGDTQYAYPAIYSIGYDGSFLVQVGDGSYVDWDTSWR